MLNALERATIAEHVSDYIIEHLLIEEPMRSNALARLAREITKDKISDPEDFETVAKLAVETLQLDPRTFVKLRGERLPWVYHKEWPQHHEG